MLLIRSDFNLCIKSSKDILIGNKIYILSKTWRTFIVTPPSQLHAKTEG
jgi:hypothetical protein